MINIVAEELKKYSDYVDNKLQHWSDVVLDKWKGWTQPTVFRNFKSSINKSDY